MKTQNIFSILLLSLILISACKESEEGTPRQTTQAYTYSQNLRGSAGVKGELPLPELKLADVVGDEIARNLKDAELQLAQSYLEISGLNNIVTPDTTAVVLKDFTIRVGNRQAVNLGDCSTDPQRINEFPSDVQLSTNEMVNIVQHVFSDITSGSKRANITVSFSPNVDITSADNVQLKIHFGGIYHYVVLE